MNPIAEYAVALLLITVMVSFLLVPNSYSPGLITPTVAGRLEVWKAMDLALPSKYSLTFSMGYAPQNCGSLLYGNFVQLQ